jgi:hypothetical protein
MSQHLSNKQFARCFTGETADAGMLRHIQECPQCSAELERFGVTVAALQGWIRRSVQVRTAVPFEIAEARPQTASPVLAGLSRAAVVVAVLILGSAPLWLPGNQRTHEAPVAAREIDPSELMDAISLHLSRELPSPLEPVMVIEPGSGSLFYLGGSQ